MTIARAVIAEVVNLGARIEVKGGRVVLHVGAQPVPADLIRRLRESRSALLEILSANPSAPTDTVTTTVARDIVSRPAQPTGQDTEALAGRARAREVPTLPPLVQAVLDRFPGAEVVAVRRYGQDRTFAPAPDWWTDPPLTYAEGSRASTASLPPPHRMTARWALEVHLRDFGLPTSRGDKERNKGPP